MAVPYQDSNKNKKAQVAEMFDNIAHSYDFLNHSLSFGIDKVWRKKTMRLVKHKVNASILDVATGTGDFAIALIRNKPSAIVGVDISEGMLTIGKAKIRKRKLEHKITLRQGDSENLQFDSNTFDVLTCAFGVRNFENLQKGLEEMHRVLKPTGVVAILEFSIPKNVVFRKIYALYFTRILPFFGRLVSKDNAAYNYLPNSVYEFPYGEKFITILKSVGFVNTKIKPLAFGIASIYYGEKA